jgi:flagellar hook-length control protein FliK
MTQSTHTGHSVSQPLFAATDDPVLAMTRKNGKKSEKLDPILSGLFAHELESYAQDKDLPGSKLITADSGSSEGADESMDGRQNSLPLLTEAESTRGGFERSTISAQVRTNGAQLTTESAGASRFGPAHLAATAKGAHGHQTREAGPVAQTNQAAKQSGVQSNQGKPVLMAQQSTEHGTKPGFKDASSAKARGGPDFAGSELTERLTGEKSLDQPSREPLVTSKVRSLSVQSGSAQAAPVNGKNSAQTPAQARVESSAKVGRVDSAGSLGGAGALGISRSANQNDKPKTNGVSDLSATQKVARKPNVSDTAGSPIAKTVHAKSRDSTTTNFVSKEVSQTPASISSPTPATLAPVGGAVLTPLPQPGIDTQTMQASSEFIDVPPVEASVEQPLFKVQLSQRVADAIGQGVQRARIQVNPQELGPVQIELNLDGQQASVSFSAPHSETRDAIRLSLDQLRAHLDEQGIELAQADVSSGESHDSNNADDRTDEVSEMSKLHSGLATEDEERDIKQHANRPTSNNRTVDLFV